MSGSADAVDVIIVGAGPVGLTLANILGQWGMTVRVLEAREKLIDFPRGIGIDDETLRVFQNIGLVEKVMQFVTPNNRVIFKTRSGKTLAEMAPTTQEFGWPRRSSFIQPSVDRVLLEGLGRYDRVDVSWGVQVQHIIQHPSEVSLTMQTLGDSGTETVRAKFLVGCDGGSSTVRKQLGVGFAGVTDSTRWVVVDLRNDPLGTPNAYVGCDPRRPWYMGGLPNGIRRFEFMLFDGELADDQIAPEFVSALLRPFIGEPNPEDFIRMRVYTHHSRVAETFVRDRVMLAGDAAHCMPVWQGQGYNSGIRDAGNLGWKLALVVAGQASAGLLQSYDAERRPHASSMVELSRRFGVYLGQTSRPAAAVRDFVTLAMRRVPAVREYLMQSRYKPMPKYLAATAPVVSDVDRPSPRGTLMIQPTVTWRGSRKPLDDAIGRGFAIIQWSGDPRSSLSWEELRRWRSLGATFIKVVPVGQLAWAEREEDSKEYRVLGDTTGALREWFDTHPWPVIFLRPDRVIAGLALAQDSERISRQLASVLGLTQPSAARIDSMKELA